MPRFPCPEGEDEQTWFVKEVNAGLRRRFPEGVPEYAATQATFETDVIVSSGGMPATSSSSPTSSTGPRTTEFG